MRACSARPARSFISSTVRLANCSAKTTESSALPAAPREGSVGAAQPAHRKLDRAIGKLPPAFDRAHITGLRVAGEIVPRLRSRLIARQRECLAQIAVASLAPGRHPAGQIPRTESHVRTPNTPQPRQY